jgi:hypothetical protein
VLPETDSKTTCVECDTAAPPTHGDLTLLSKLGWRLVRKHDLSGNVLSEWRCPDCAEKYKKKRALQGMASGFHRSVVVTKKPNEE